MIVMKFGGTSVGSGERIARVASLVQRRDGPTVVVVSAVGGTTDQLLRAGRAAEAGDLGAARELVEAMRRRHLEAAPRPEGLFELDRLFAELTSLLQGVYLLREQTARSRALLASFGAASQHSHLGSGIMRLVHECFVIFYLSESIWVLEQCPKEARLDKNW